MVVDPPHPVFIPDRITDTALHGPNVAPLHFQSDRLDRLALQITELPNHIAKKVFPRFAPRKAIGECLMKPLQFLHEPIDIARGQIQLGNRESFACGPTCWYHSLPPVASLTI